MISSGIVTIKRPIPGKLFLSIIALLLLGACGEVDTPRGTQQPPSPQRTTKARSTPTVILPRVQMDQSQESSVTPQPTQDPLKLTVEPSPDRSQPTSSITDETRQNANALPTPSLIRHTVEAGETILGIATRYGISMAAIQLVNEMGSSIDLLAGQTLLIPRSTQWRGESRFWIVHVVQSGQTLVGLAEAYGMTVDDILRVNAIADPALIRVDQQLVVPLEQLVSLAAQRPTATRRAVAAAPAVATPQAAVAPTASNTSPETGSAAAADTLEPEAPSTPPMPPAGPSDWPGVLLARINQVRAEHGLTALSLVTELNYAAQAHADDCARRGWGSHVGSDGAVLKTRLERAGYLGRNWGENWVQAQNAARAFDWWYGEIPPNDPHRRNILSPRYAEIGIGIASTRSGYIFITDFGRR